MPYNLQLFFCICLLLRGERVSLSVERRYLSVLMHMFQSMRIMLTTYSRSQGVPFLFQGLCEQTVNVLQLMEEEGFEPSLVMLNSLINAFGTAGRHLEALAVFQHIKDSVCTTSRNEMKIVFKNLVLKFCFLCTPMITCSFFL